MDHQSWSHLIAQQETGLATCRSSIESSSTVTNLAIIDGKSTVVSHLKASFSDLVVLTRYIDGDYDSRIKAKELPPASSENSAIASLVNNAETAVVKSDAISKQVQLEVVQIMGVRTRLGTIRDAINTAKAGVRQDVSVLQQSIEVQKVLVTEADASKVVAENAYQVAKERSEKAEPNAKWWKEYAEYKPPWYLALLGGSKDPGYGMHSEKTEKLLWAIKQKEAAAIDARALEERHKELLEHKTKLHSLEVENAQLETALAQMQHAQTIALRDIHECEVVISRCREVEEAMVQCKQTLNSMLDKCAHLEELVTRAQGTFNGVLVDQANVVLQTLEAGDLTGLLKENSLAKLEVVVQGLVRGFADLGPFSKM